jgi:cobalt/nickel transport system permease protein
LAGLTAVFIFAVQMLNFPVAAGTSGHLIGGALAAILVGPWAATLALTIVLLMQAITGRCNIYRDEKSLAFS